MAKEHADRKTIDLLSGKPGRSMTVDERREYLRKKKAESRRRATRRKDNDPDVTDQVTLTITRGARAILEFIAEREGKSMSSVVDELIKSHPAARAARARNHDVFGGK